MSNHTPDKPVTPEQRRYIAAELNLARLPYFASSTSNLKKKASATYRHVAKEPHGEVEILWKVTANAEFGYPGPFAESVHAALLDIVTEEGLPFQNPITFTFYNLCSRLDIEYNGRNVEHIRNALYAIRLAGIVIKNSFITKNGRRKSFYPDPVNLYHRVVCVGEEDLETGERKDASAVWLSDFYLDSINSGNIRPIDFEYFKHLHKRSFVATKLYQYLGYRFASTFKHDNDYAKVDYDELAVIGDVKRQQYLSHIKQQLRRAHEALSESGYIQKIDWIQEKQADGPNKFYIHYYPGDHARREYGEARLTLGRQLKLPMLEAKGEENTDASEPEHTFSKEPPALIHDLESLGITSSRAKELVHQFSHDRITRQLDHLEYLGEEGRSPNDAPAWLVSAIENDYSPPPGFKNRAEREAEQRARAKAAAEKEKERKEEKRRRKEQQAQYEKLDERLAALSEKQQNEIEQEISERIKSGFSEFMRSLYRTKTFDPKSPMHQAEYYEHLEDLLEEHVSSD